MRKSVLFFILSFTISFSAYSQSHTGLDLLRGCRAIMNQAEGKENAMDESLHSLYWLGFLAGFNEATTITHALSKSAPYCIPEQGVETEQLALIVHKYLKEHPDILHETARVCLLLSLKDTFPCGK